MTLAQLQLQADDLVDVEPGDACNLTKRKRGFAQQCRGMATGIHAARLGPPLDGCAGNLAAQFVAIQPARLGGAQRRLAPGLVIVDEGVHEVGRAGEAIERLRTKADIIGHMGIATLEVGRRFMLRTTGCRLIQGQAEAFRQTGRRGQRIRPLALKRAFGRELQQIVEALPLRL